MRVAYDGVVFQNGHQRGVQRAFRELIEHLPSGIDADLVLAEAPKVALPERATITSIGLPGNRLLPRRARRRAQRLLGRSGRARAETRADVFHSTYYTGPVHPMPTVLTVHDLVTERFSEFSAGKHETELFARRRALVETATRIVAISRSTKDELARFYPGAEDKTTIVHWSWEHLRRADAPEPGRPETRYALVVGDRHGYKNFRVVLDALEQEHWPADVGLVVAGPPWSGAEAFRVGLLGDRRRVRHAGRPDDASLSRLYAGAACVLAPSLMEGFGFPILEAQAAGVPVVCSDIAVFAEVAGAGALLFQPHRPEELGRSVSAVMDVGVRARLVEAGRENLARFSWSRCAEETAAVYEEAATAG